MRWFSNGLFNQEAINSAADTTDVKVELRLVYKLLRSSIVNSSSYPMLRANPFTYLEDRSSCRSSSSCSNTIFNDGNVYFVTGCIQYSIRYGIASLSKILQLIAGSASHCYIGVSSVVGLETILAFISSTCFRKFSKVISQ